MNKANDVLQSYESRGKTVLVLDEGNAPVRSMVVGIVDEVNLESN